MTKIEKLEKKLIEAKKMHEIVGDEVHTYASKGWRIQLKSAQNRSVSLARQITNLEEQIRKAKTE